MLRLRALAYFALLAAVFIWGVNFVVVKEAVKSWKDQEFTFLAARFWLACIAYGAVLISATGQLREPSPSADSSRRAFGSPASLTARF